MLGNRKLLRLPQATTAAVFTNEGAGASARQSAEWTLDHGLVARPLCGHRTGRESLTNTIIV